MLLLWKKGITVEVIVVRSVNSVQFAFLDAVTAFLSSIFRREYFSCKVLGLLFQPPCARIHEKNSSTWSCEYLYVRTYLNGLLVLDNISWAISIVDFMSATKPIINVFRGCVERSWAGTVSVFKDSR